MTVEGRTHEIVIGPDGITVDGDAVTADLRRVPGTESWSLLIDGSSVTFEARREEANGVWRLHLPAGPLHASVMNRAARAEDPARGRVTAGPKPVTAPMPGLVVRVEVEPGDDVEAGQGLVIVEAMKMENELRATGPARVRAVHVKSGQSVEKGEVLVDLESRPDRESPEP